MQLEEIKQLVIQTKNIYIIPENKGPENISCALALFYTLKELGKNVNLVIDTLPDNLKFLIPSLDFVSYPKNFVVSIPNKIAEVSQIYYEKGDEQLKIHLTINKGNIKKEDISFYYAESKPDLVITVGIQNFKDYLSDKLNSFGFLLDSNILNIDNRQDNQKFGNINLVTETALAKTTLQVIKSISSQTFKKETATCLLASLIFHTDNFKNQKVTAEIFELAAMLMKEGADLKDITSNIT